MIDKFTYNLTPEKDYKESVILEIDNNGIQSLLLNLKYPENSKYMYKVLFYKEDNIFNPEILRDLANKIEEYNKSK